MPTPPRVDGGGHVPPARQVAQGTHPVSDDQAAAAARLRGLLGGEGPFPGSKGPAHRQLPPGKPSDPANPERPDAADEAAQPLFQTEGHHGLVVADARSRGPGDPASRDAEVGQDASHLGPVARHGQGGDGNGDAEDDGPEEQASLPDPRPAPLSGGDAILAGLGMALPGAGTAAAATWAAPAATPRTDLSSLVDQLAGQVLVGQRADGEQEIRVTLRGPTLDGTEVRIALHQGTLEIHVTPKSAAAQELLRMEGPSLSDTLAQRLGQPVVVDVAAGGDAGQPNDQDGRRSRSYDDILRYAAGRDT